MRVVTLLLMQGRGGRVCPTPLAAAETGKRSRGGSGRAVVRRAPPPATLPRGAEDLNLGGRHRRRRGPGRRRRLRLRGLLVGRDPLPPLLLHPGRGGRSLRDGLERVGQGTR